MKRFYIIGGALLAGIALVLGIGLYPMVTGAMAENQSFESLVAQGKTLKQNNKWRGIIFGPEGQQSPDDFIEDFAHLVDETLAPIGINLVIFDMHWNNFQFTKVPGLEKVKRAPRFNFTHAHAAKMAEICRRNGIRVGVGMNFLTHQNYGQLLKAFPDYQWPGKENLWDPMNPEVNKVAFAMADELIDAFGADVIHIGMDEAWGFNVKDNPKAKGMTNAELLAREIRAYHKHFVEQGHKDMIMWSDTLEGRYKDVPVGNVLDLLPKDIIMATWEYGRKFQYPWPQRLVDKGFRVLVCPWKDPVASQKLAMAGAAVHSDRMLGILYTTWSPSVATKLAGALRGEITDSGDDAIVGVAHSIRRTIGLF